MDLGFFGGSLRIWAQQRDRDELLNGGGRSRRWILEPDPGRRCPFRPPSSGAPSMKLQHNRREAAWI
jgi:hypothetical protein